MNNVVFYVEHGAQKHVLRVYNNGENTGATRLVTQHICRSSTLADAPAVWVTPRPPG